MGNPDAAIADCSRAIELNPGDAEAFNNRGLAKRAKGDLAGAIADFDQSILLKANDATAYVNRGLCPF